MNFESLEDIANHIVSDGKGILAKIPLPSETI